MIAFARYHATTMSMKGSAMFDRWKRTRSHSGISSDSSASAAVSTRPTTAINSWKEYSPEQDGPAFQKVVENALLVALGSDLFRNAVASQIDPVSESLSRQQEKLNQLKAANINIQSTIDTQLGAEGLTAIFKPSLDDHLSSLTQLVKEIPHHGKEMDNLLTSQKTLLDSMKFMDKRMNGLETQVEEFGERIQILEDQLVNGDLRSAIRFGEMSNELQDRNAVLVDRIWGVERDIGKKIDGQQRRVIGVCEELGNRLKAVQDQVSSLDTSPLSSYSGKVDVIATSSSQMAERLEKVERTISKLEELHTNMKATEQGMGRDIHMIRDKVSTLNTSSLDSQGKRLDSIDRGMNDVRKEIEVQGTLASLDSKLLSTNTARLETLASHLAAVGRILDSVKEQVSAQDESLFSQTEKLDSIATTASSVKDTFGSLQSRVEVLDTSLLASQSKKMEEIATTLMGVSETVDLVRKDVSNPDTSILSSHFEKLESLDNRLSGIRSSLDAGLLSHNKGFEDIREKLSLPIDTSKLDALNSMLEDLKSATENELQSQSGLLQSILDVASAPPDNSLLSSHSEMLSKISDNLAILHSDTTASLETVTQALKSVDSQVTRGNLHSQEKTMDLRSQIERVTSDLDHHRTLLEDIKGQNITDSVVLAINDAQDSNNSALHHIKKSIDELHSSSMSELRHQAAGILGSLEQSRASQLESIEEIGNKHANSISDFRHEAVAILEKLSASHESNSALLSILKESTSKKQDLVSIESQLTDIIKALKNQDTALEHTATSNDISDLKELLTTCESLINANAAILSDLANSQTNKEILTATKDIRVAVTKVNDSVSSLDAEVLGEIESLKSAADGHKLAIDEMQHAIERSEVKSFVSSILDEIRANKNTLEQVQKGTATRETMLEQFGSLKNAIEKSNTAQTVELLEQILLVESVASSIKTTSKENQILEAVDSIKDLSQQSSGSISEILAALQTIKDDATESQTLNEISALKQLTKINASSLANAYEGIISVDTKIKTSEDSICAAIDKLHSTVETELLDNKTTVATSINDVATELKIDIKDIGARLVTSTNILRADIKDIDFSPTHASIDALAKDVEAVDLGMKESNKAVKANEAVLKKVNSLLNEQLPRLREEINAIDLSTLEANSVQSSQAVEAIDAGMKDIIKLAKANELTVSTIDNKVAKQGRTLDLMSPELPLIRKAIDNVDIAVFRSATETRDSLKANEAIVSGINGAVSKTSASIESLMAKDIPRLHENIGGINAELEENAGQIIEAVKANQTSLGATRTDLSSFESSTKKLLETIVSEVLALDLLSILKEAQTATLATRENKITLETLHADVLNRLATALSIEALLSEIKAIDTAINQTTTAIRIHGAALSRVDKSVIETGAQIKSVVVEGHEKLSEELDAAVSQLDESIHDNGTRIRGISEYDVPRLETNIKGIDTTLDRLTQSNVNATQRNREALEVIGGRVVGTWKKFDELVEAHAARSKNHEGSEDGRESMENSRTLGGKGDHRLWGTRRSRGGSNASSSKEAKEAGLRIVSYS